MGSPGPKLVVNTPKPVRARHAVRRGCTPREPCSGNIYDFDLRGRAGGENVVARGNFVRQFHERVRVDERADAAVEARRRRRRRQRERDGLCVRHGECAA